jgi:adenosylhomocysteine nucleosidase
METGLICLIAAMPEEIKPLLRLAGSCKKERIDGFDAYRFSFGKEKLLLVRSGIGLDNAAAASNALIKHAKPCLIVNFGFCGAVTPGPQVGDIVVAQRILLNRKELFSPQSGIVEEEAKRITRSLADAMAAREITVYGGVFVTCAEIKSKSEMARLLPSWAKKPVLDMETAAVALAAAKGGVPFMAVRGISDDAEEELGFSISELSDKLMNIRIGKVFLAVARKPWIIPQLLRLSKNSRKTGENLALAIAGLLEDTDELPLRRINRLR